MMNVNQVKHRLYSTQKNLEKLSLEEFAALATSVDEGKPDRKALKALFHPLPEALRPEDELHTLSPDKKKSKLVEAVIDKKLRYKDHPETIADFKKKVIFVCCKKVSNKKSKSLVAETIVTKYCTYCTPSQEVPKEHSELPTEWASDVWFKHLLKMAEEFRSKSDAVDPLMVTRSSHICYCLLIRYKDKDGNVQHQIYVGQDNGGGRWKGGINGETGGGSCHFTKTSKLLKGTARDGESSDLAFAYFGGASAAVFVIGHDTDESPLSQAFPFPDGTKHTLKTHPISLSRIDGAAKSGKASSEGKKPKTVSKSETKATKSEESSRSTNSSVESKTASKGTKKVTKSDDASGSTASSVESQHATKLPLPVRYKLSHNLVEAFGKRGSSSSEDEEPIKVVKSTKSNNATVKKVQKGDKK